MEPAQIDWEKIDSIFVEDQVYENINAPQWVDLLSPISPSRSPDDVAWFCRKDCKHPRTAEDFLNSTPPCSSSKLLRSVSVSKLIEIVDWTRREPNLKKRVGVAPSLTSNDDAENQNPNFCTPTTTKIKRPGEANKVPFSLALNNVKRKDEERLLLPIRTNPPTPQGFSVTRDPDPLKTTPSKGPKSRLMETGNYEEHAKNASVIEGNNKERRAFDVFWFFKPCTLST